MYVMAGQKLIGLITVCCEPSFFTFACSILFWNCALVCPVLLFCSSSQCFSIAFLSPVLTSPVHDLLISVSVYSLCSPLCHCQIVPHLSVFPHDATLCSPPVSPPVSPRWYVSGFCSLSFQWFALFKLFCWYSCLLSFWLTFGLPGLFGFCVYINFCLIKPLVS